MTYSKLRPEHSDTQVCQPYVRHPVGRTIGALGYQVATNESSLLHQQQMLEHVGVIRKFLQMTIVDRENPISQMAVDLAQNSLNQFLIEGTHCRFHGFQRLLKVETPPEAALARRDSRWCLCLGARTSLASLKALSNAIAYQPTSICHQLRPNCAAFASA